MFGVTEVTVSKEMGVFMENSERGLQVQSFEVKMQEDINLFWKVRKDPYPEITQTLRTALWGK